MNKNVSLAAISLLLVLSVAILYYFATSNYSATGVFWSGSAAGFFTCLFLSSLTLTFLLIKTKNASNKKRHLSFSLIVLLGSVTAVFIYFKPGDSDLWWYGAIAGFLCCLLLVFLVLIGYLALKILK